MKKLWNLTVILTVVTSVVFFSGCPAAGGSSASSDLTADEYVNKALDAMKTGDYESALDYFSSAVAQDKTNDQAVLGYSLLNIASISADPAMVKMAKTNLGIKDYPSSMNEFSDPANWLVDTYMYTDDDGTDEYILFPEITGEEDRDGNGIIDLNERLYALFKYVFTNNTGFDFVPETIDALLGDRLNKAVAVIKNYATDSMKLTLTWDMFVTDKANWGLYESDGTTPVDIVLGKAELLLLASQLEYMASVVELIQVYSLVLPMNDIYKLIADGTNLSGNPLDTFLKPNSDAASRLLAAKAHLNDAFNDLKTASDSILSNRSGFTLSSTSPLFIGNADAWTSVEKGFKIASKISTEALASLNNSVMLYIPNNPLSYDDFLNNGTWPNGFTDNYKYDDSTEEWVAGTDDYYDQLGINLGKLFSDPITIFGASGDSDVLINLADDGDFALYLDNGSGGYKALSANDFDTGNLDDTQGPFYIKLNYDLLIEDIFPIDNFGVNVPDEYSSPSYYIEVPFSPVLAWLTVASDGNSATYDGGNSTAVCTDGTLWQSLGQFHE